MKYQDFFFESDASDEAHKKGLKSAGWGKWKDKSGDTVAKTENGKLVLLNKKNSSIDDPHKDERDRIAAGTKRIGDTFVAPDVVPPPIETNSFLNSLPARLRAKANAALDTNVLNRGRLITRRDLVKEIVDEGGTIVNHPKDGRRLMRPDGSFVEQSRLTKVAMDYAVAMIQDNKKKSTATSENTPENILNEPVDIGIKKGMNDGGTYKGKDGKIRYVKFYKNPIVAHDEKLCNDFYIDVGLKAPVSTTFQKDGKTIFASEMVQEVKGEVAKFVKNDIIPKPIANEILKGFVADCFMANWDALGMNEGYMRNMLVLNDGSIARIDQGGALLTGGLGQEKPKKALMALAEWEYFPTQNPSYKHVFESAGISKPEQIPNVKEQIAKVLSLGKNGWNKYIESKVPDMPTDAQNEISKILEFRANILRKKI